MEEKVREVVFIHYYRALSANIGHLVREFDLSLIFCPFGKIKQSLLSVNVDLGLRLPVVCNIPCFYGRCYIGQKGTLWLIAARSMSTISICSNMQYLHWQNIV